MLGEKGKAKLKMGLKSAFGFLSLKTSTLQPKIKHGLKMNEFILGV